MLQFLGIEAVLYVKGNNFHYFLPLRQVKVTFWLLFTLFRVKATYLKLVFLFLATVEVVPY